MIVLASACAKIACWTFLLVTMAPGGDYTAVYNRYPDQMICAKYRDPKYLVPNPTFQNCDLLAVHGIASGEALCKAEAKRVRQEHNHKNPLPCQKVTVDELSQTITHIEKVLLKRQKTASAKPAEANVAALPESLVQLFRSPSITPAPIPVAGRLRSAGESEKDYQKREIRCLATAIYFEARGESRKGQEAVAQVVLNRVRIPAYPDTICGVVYQGQHRRTGCQFSFTCDGIKDFPTNRKKWRTANRIAKEATEGKVWLGDIGHATHYHANYVSPGWRHRLNRVKKVGAHIFYRSRGDQMKDALL